MFKGVPHHFWNKMFIECNAIVKDGEVIFENEDDEEKFYELYGFVVDEYPSHTNDENCFCSISYNNMFNSLPLIMSIY